MKRTKPEYGGGLRELSHAELGMFQVRRECPAHAPPPAPRPLPRPTLPPTSPHLFQHPSSPFFRPPTPLTLVRGVGSELFFLIALFSSCPCAAYFTGKKYASLPSSSSQFLPSMPVPPPPSPTSYSPCQSPLPHRPFPSSCQSFLPHRLLPTPQASPPSPITHFLHPMLVQPSTSNACPISHTCLPLAPSHATPDGLPIQATEIKCKWISHVRPRLLHLLQNFFSSLPAHLLQRHVTLPL